MDSSLTLYTGAKLPSVGFGFWKVDKPQAAEVCRTAIECGYRHLDCACDYGNEVEVGQGIAEVIQSGMVRRDELWVTSKLWNTYHAAEHVQPACERTLKDLGLDYLQRYCDQIRGVTPQTAAQAAREHLQPEQLVTLVMGPAARCAEALRELGSVEILNEI